MLNALLDAEVDQLNAARRDPGRQLRVVTADQGRPRYLKVPKLRRQTFQTIIERYRGRESSLIEMYLAGISVRRVEDITEALGARALARARCRT